MFNPCIVIPVYDHERAVAPMLAALRSYGLPCILVDDGSSEACAQVLDALVVTESSWVRLLRHPNNQGKGAAVVTALEEAARRGHTHALQIDADGQHDPADIPRFLAAAREHPDRVICGAPLFDDSAPLSRLWGRKLTTFWIAVNSLSLQVKDGLCGYRLYPLVPLLDLFARAKLGTRMDFDPELLVRLTWDGLEVVNLPVKVRYPLDGVSHFRLLPDNGLITWMHTRLFFGMLLRLPRLLWRKLKPENSGHSKSWSELQELGSARGLAFLFWIYRHLGRAPFRVVLYPVLAWFFLLKRTPRQASLEFLTRALHRRATLGEGFAHFRAFAEAMLDKLVAWNGGFSLSDVDFHGRERLGALLSEGKGCLLIGSHLGNLEVCRVLSRWRPDFELHVLVHTRHAENFNRIVKRLDPKSELHLHQVTELDAGLAAWVSARVEAGAVVVIAGDRVPVATARVTLVPFFGKPAPFAEGPYVLAHALGCPVLLFFCVRKGQGFQVEFEPFADAIRLPRGPERQAAISTWAMRYAQRLEAHAEKTPFQWFNFYPYWPDGHADP